MYVLKCKLYKHACIFTNIHIRFTPPPLSLSLIIILMIIDQQSNQVFKCIFYTLSSILGICVKVKIWHNAISFWTTY